MTTSQLIGRQRALLGPRSMRLKMMLESECLLRITFPCDQEPQQTPRHPSIRLLLVAQPLATAEQRLGLSRAAERLGTEGMRTTTSWVTMDSTKTLCQTTAPTTLDGWH